MRLKELRYLIDNQKREKMQMNNFWDFHRINNKIFLFFIF